MIGSQDLSVRDLQKEVRKLRAELRKDISGVKSYIKGLDTASSLPNVAVSKFEKVDAQMKGKNLKDIDEKTLRNIYRDLKYIRGLKTSTKEGAYQSRELWSPIEDKLKDLNKMQKKRFFKAYDKLYNEIPNILQFKYEIFDLAIDKAKQLNQNELIKYMKSMLGITKQNKEIVFTPKSDGTPLEMSYEEFQNLLR